MITLRKQHNSCSWRMSVKEKEVFSPLGCETIASFICNNLAIVCCIPMGQ